MVRPLIPDVELQLAAPMLAKVTPVAGAFGNEQEGKELALVDWKSLGFPKKSQRSVTSPFVLFPVVAVPMLKAFAVSYMDHGWELCRLRMVLSFQPSSSWPKPFFPGMA